MTVLAYTGVPGSGKSAHAARNIRYALCNPRHEKPVLANFPLSPNAPVTHPDNYTYMSNEQITADKVMTFCEDYWKSHDVPFAEDYITVVLDECGVLFNSRNWQKSAHMGWLEFLSQSRKVGAKVILISQSLMMVDNQFRMQVETEHNHRRLKSGGALGWLLSMLVGGNLMLDVKYLLYAGKRERLGMELFRPGRKDFAMYDSYARFARIE